MKVFLKSSSNLRNNDDTNDSQVRSFRVGESTILGKLYVGVQSILWHQQNKVIRCPISYIIMQNFVSEGGYNSCPPVYVHDMARQIFHVSSSFVSMF